MRGETWEHICAGEAAARCSCLSACCCSLHNTCQQLSSLYLHRIIPLFFRPVPVVPVWVFSVFKVFLFLLYKSAAGYINSNRVMSPYVNLTQEHRWRSGVFVYRFSCSWNFSRLPSVIIRRVICIFLSLYAPFSHVSLLRFDHLSFVLLYSSVLFDPIH